MKTKIIICIVLILAIITGTVIANPQILYYNNINGLWYNDHNELVNGAQIIEFNDLTPLPEWSIEVIEPELHYDNERVYSNGESIIIVTGSGTISLTAAQTITITVNP